MNILVTGSNGFVGKNLVENLKCVRDGKNRTRPGLTIDKIYEYDRDNTLDELAAWSKDADFVFHLAGVNRPRDSREFEVGNCALTSTLLSFLEDAKNPCPVMLSSSVQATLAGRFGASDYGLSKRRAEELVFSHAESNTSVAYVFRFPNIVGKWARPNYNSAVATFCHNIARDLPITISDPTVELELLFVEDLVEAMLDILEGIVCRCEYPAAGLVVDGVVYDGVTPLEKDDGRFCLVPKTYRATLSEIVETIQSFHDQPHTLLMPSVAPDSLQKKLYSTYLSYLPQESVAFDLKTNSDQRGSFTEVIKTFDHGQFSVNVSEPGVTKGQHWHNSKWELFIVVSGRALIRERLVGSNEVMEFEVSSDDLKAVHMLPGCTHSITNLSDTEKLVTLMWANEVFDANRPDTFYEEV